MAFADNLLIKNSRIGSCFERRGGNTGYSLTMTATFQSVVVRLTNLLSIYKSGQREKKMSTSPAKKLNTGKKVILVTVSAPFRKFELFKERDVSIGLFSVLYRRPTITRPRGLRMMCISAVCNYLKLTQDRKIIGRYRTCRERHSRGSGDAKAGVEATR